MVANCANPNCSRPFRYLRHGRLHVVEFLEDRDGTTVRRLEHFWLCENCSPNYRITFDLARGVVCQPKLLTPDEPVQIANLR
jgi:hypothetical protein